MDFDWNITLSCYDMGIESIGGKLPNYGKRKVTIKTREDCECLLGCFNLELCLLCNFTDLLDCIGCIL